MKRGRKPSPNKKKRTTVTLDAPLVAEIETRTENLSGYLNEAGWGHLSRWDKARRQPAPRGTKVTRKSP